jgi:hypothetical protein
MKEDYWFGAVSGFVLGALLMSGYSIYLRDRGRDECDAKLPRTQSCVQKWLPPETTAPKKEFP